MRLIFTVILSVLMVGAVIPAFAELQNVEVGGSIRIRANYYSPEAAVPDFDDNGDSLSFIEQRTRLNVKADFTDDVSVFIELDSYDVFGEDFRSVYVTGIDARQAGSGAASTDDLEVYQAYIDINNAWGRNLNIRIGRQEIVLGSEWLFGNNDTAALFRGLSFDGITATYFGDSYSVSAGYVKVADTSPVEEDGDADVWGIYASYTGWEPVSLDAYWLFVRDAFNLGAFGEPSELHTIGLRLYGSHNNWDYEFEGAYQKGSAEAVGPSVDYDAFAFNSEVGYTFDHNMQPRVWFGLAFFEGADDDELSFNRLFSDWEYSEFLANTDLSNALILRGGVSFQPTESTSLSAVFSYFQADETRDLGPFAGSADDELGWEVGLYVDYDYSEDLHFQVGYAHFFADDGLEDGNFVVANGLGLLGGLSAGGRGIGPKSDDDADYIYVETTISF